MDQYKPCDVLINSACNGAVNLNLQMEIGLTNYTQINNLWPGLE